MKRVCAWCKNKMGEDGNKDFLITHTICDECKIKLIYKNVPMKDFIDQLVRPVLVVNSEGRVKTGNEAACEMLNKGIDSMEGYMGGDVVECAYAKLPGGCGKTEHCTGCTIRNTVMRTFSTGKSQSKVEAYQYIQMPDDVKKMRFLITTEKVGEIVLLKIDEAGVWRESDHRIKGTLPRKALQRGTACDD